MTDEEIIETFYIFFERWYQRCKKVGFGEKMDNLNDHDIEMIFIDLAYRSASEKEYETYKMFQYSNRYHCLEYLQNLGLIEETTRGKIPTYKVTRTADRLFKALVVL